MKWGVVIAGASDFVRPAEKLSITQNIALTEKYAVSVHTKIPDNLMAPKYPPPPVMA
jgi:hypothetical protein